MAKGKLRKLFTNEEILEAHEAKGKTHKILTGLGRGKISRQLADYWVKHLTEYTKQNGEPYVGTTVMDRSLREKMTLRTPTPFDDKALSGEHMGNERILCIPDQHAPYHHPDALAFLAAVKETYNPTRVVNLGDETDGHALSMHDSDPNLDSAGVELEKAREFIKELAEIFPVMDVCHSNHGSLIYRRAYKHGIPTQYIKTYREILFPNGGGEGWEWADRFTAVLPNGEKVIFQHQSAGDTLANAAHERSSIVEGHEHGKFEIQYRASSEALYFSMISGCLINHKAMAFAYGKLFPKKPILGCSLILDSRPVLIPMELDISGRWTGRLHQL